MCPKGAKTLTSDQKGTLRFSKAGKNKKVALLPTNKGSEAEEENGKNQKRVPAYGTPSFFLSIYLN